MGFFGSLLKGETVLEEVTSPANGKITVHKSLAWGTYLSVGNLTQSGGVVRDIWKSTLTKLKKENSDVKDCLILGIGGGSNAQLVRKFWQYSRITGIDFDQVIVDLGKKYLGLDDINVKLIVSDAYEFVENEAKFDHKYDLILIDLYVGSEYPFVFESDEFIKHIKSLLHEQGRVIFNRLYSDEKRSSASKFGQKLEKTFSKVEYFYPQANLMLICSY